MADPRLVNEWLEKAEEDFEFANSKKKPLKPKKR